MYLKCANTEERRFYKMDLQKEITKLVQYGLDHELIQPEDKIYTINQYLEIFHLDEYEEPDISGEEIVLEDIFKESAGCGI